ncbi:hypothetical protein [Luteimonas huabeiensis]|uniref:hypothetical protein n=1 Tax=Luteimonas huabeiensis TaxID=1244513 RepID=UPI001F2C81FE|nr:hypothetical protein [Luteimonas huabeiensis]
MTALPPPPVPQKLRDMLKDYPEHIERLQETLQRIVNKRLPGADPFERAIWLLESRLSTFISEARDELQAAESSGDPEAIKRAKEKELRMLDARTLPSLHDLHEYFIRNKEMFE